MLLLNMFASGYFQTEVKAYGISPDSETMTAINYVLNLVYTKYPKSKNLDFVFIRNDFEYGYMKFYLSDRDTNFNFSYSNNILAEMHFSMSFGFKINNLEGIDDSDVILHSGVGSSYFYDYSMIYGRYTINGVHHDDISPLPIDYSKYYCKYTLVDGTVTDDSSALLREGGGGSSRGGGAGRYSRAHFPFDPDKVTDIDTKTDDEVKLDVKNKYVRVCYDRVEKKWQPHGRISVVNNTIINNTYITSDDKELDETGEETTPTDPEEPPIEDNWPSDTPSWIKVLADILGGILKGIGEAIGGVAKLIIDGISGLFHTLFVPSENFIGDNFTTLQNNFNEKMPVMKQISETSSSVQNSLFGNTSTEAPNITITLPKEMMLGDITIDAFDFTFFNQYRDMIHSIIIFMMYTPFVLSLPKRIKDALG